MFNFIKRFPNNIFIPKIVPLVYDDTLSYLEFCYKVVVKLNEVIETCNSLGVRVDDLEQAVAQLQNIIDGIDERLSTAEGKISTLEGKVSDIELAITNINNSIDGINNQISILVTNVENNTSSITEINSAISDIRDSLADLSDVTGDIDDLEQDISGLDTRVSQLEQATFGDIELSPVPKNFSCNMMMFDKLDYEIVKPEPYDTSLDDTVKIEYGCFRFRGATNYNQTHLKLPNFCPKLPNNEALTLAIIFADYYSEYGQALNTTFGDLVSGVNMIVGVTNEICVGGAKLVLNTDGDYQMYDLHLYVNSQNGSGDYIANSRFYLEWCAILGGVGYLSDGRGSADNIRKYVNGYNAGIIQTGVSQTDFDTLAGRVTTAEGDIDNLENAIGTFTQSQYTTDYNNTTNSINSIVSDINQIHDDIYAQDLRVDALESKTDVETWNVWSDVFSEGSITPNSRIIDFHMRKYGKLVTFEIAGCHFRNDSNHNLTTFCLGTIRSGLRDKLAPKDNMPVTFTGFTAYTDGNLTGVEMSGDDNHANYTPLVPNGRGVAVATLYGSQTAVPDTWNNRNNLAYSLNINICNMPYQTGDSAVTNNAFIITGCYMVN